MEDSSSWVAVAYNEGFFIGKTTTVVSKSDVSVDFLVRSRDGSFKWPKKKDSDNVDAKYIFCTDPQVVQMVGTHFILHNVSAVEKQYETYHAIYIWSK